VSAYSLYWFSAVSLKTLKGLQEVIFHEVLVEHTHKALLLRRDGVEGRVGLRVLGVDRRQLGSGGDLGSSAFFGLFYACSLHNYYRQLLAKTNLVLIEINI